MRRANKGVGRGANKKMQTFQRLSLPSVACRVCVCVGVNLKVNVEIFHPLAH